MDSSWRGLILASVLLVGLASSEVTITSVKPLRLGDFFRVSCGVHSKIGQCLWEVNGRLIIPGATAPLRLAPSSSETECGVEAEATEDLNGSFICKVFTESSGGVAESANTTVSVISIPEVSLRPAVATLTVTAGERKEVICVVGNSRPVPSIVWMLGDREVDGKDYTTTSKSDASGTTSLTSILKREFVALEHNKELQCIVKADWLFDEDNTVAQTRLDVQFPPMPQNTITIYGLEENKQGEVRVTVQANPRPNRAFWILPTPSNDKLEVEPKVRETVDNNYRGHSGEDNGNGTYTYRLTIDSVAKQDSSPGIKFQVLNDVGGIEQSQQYFVQAVTSPQPEQAGLSGGGITGIIIALIALVVVIAVVLYSRNAGKLCFAGAVKPAVTSGDPEKGEPEPIVVRETSQKQGFSDRLSDIYENLVHRTQKKKGERLTATESELQRLDPEPAERKEEADGVVYAELNLKEATKPGITRIEEPTEYAEIVGIVKMKDNEEKEPEDKESSKPI